MQEASMQSEGPPLSENERIAANRAAIFAALLAERVGRAVVSYTGFADSGGPEGVRFEMSDGATLDEGAVALQYSESSRWVDGAWQSAIKQEDRPLQDAASDLAMELVEQQFGGWDVGDGAEGDVIFDATDGSVTIEHRAYFTDYEYNEVRL
ncbi:MAG: hypothetical protein QM740_20085 [Acidovorax sp.]